MPTKTIAYLRTSTGWQEFGIDAQLDQCRAFNNKIDAVFSDEGISGNVSLHKRPGLLAALDSLQNGDVLLVARRDRLCRGDPVLIAMIERLVEKRGARIISVAGEGTEGDDPTNRLMRRIVDAFAEYEILLVKARTTAALSSKKARGERTGGVPYGYKLHPMNPKELVIDEIEQEIITLIKTLRATGQSLQKIADVLTAQGYKPRGKNWHRQTIKNILNFTHSERFKHDQ
ncbi:recombinase family protein [Chromatium okenii]|uniref:Resolvase n=1 Tax=Chromatium okenii TaxID=61644 RepID=A0A2S7XTB5_9GAMM|nr:recombinase family protein [Chromatium okenii]PQJ96977.1 resolvase [Chromatium okenii]